MSYAPSAKLALDTLFHKPNLCGIPTGLFHVMEYSSIERLAGAESGAYRKDPHGVYCGMLRAVGVNLVDQYLADNPLEMGSAGYDSETVQTATTGGQALLDGIVIDSPEAVAEHLNRYAIPEMQRKNRDFCAAQVARETTCALSLQKQILGDEILSVGYGHLQFPVLLYTQYGYENFFLSWALYPELYARLYSVWADYCAQHNAAVADAYLAGGWPLFQRLDHDMADSRGLLVSPTSLETLWLPHFQRAIEPALRAGFRLIWHCDGNLMELFPSLIASGICGFQGFQYEDGMDYISICKQKTRDGAPLLIMAGISVTRTLPFGSPADVARELRFLVENGPKTGLFLSLSSSCVPGTPFANIKAAADGLRYYREHDHRKGE